MSDRVEVLISELERLSKTVETVRQSLEGTGAKLKGMATKSLFKGVMDGARQMGADLASLAKNVERATESIGKAVTNIDKIKVTSPTKFDAFRVSVGKLMNKAKDNEGREGLKKLVTILRRLDGIKIPRLNFDVKGDPVAMALSLTKILDAVSGRGQDIAALGGLGRVSFKFHGSGNVTKVADALIKLFAAIPANFQTQAAGLSYLSNITFKLTGAKNIQTLATALGNFGLVMKVYPRTLGQLLMLKNIGSVSIKASGWSSLAKHIQTMGTNSHNLTSTPFYKDIMSGALAKAFERAAIHAKSLAHSMAAIARLSGRVNAATGRHAGRTPFVPGGGGGWQGLSAAMPQNGISNIMSMISQSMGSKGGALAAIGGMLGKLSVVVQVLLAPISLIVKAVGGIFGFITSIFTTLFRITGMVYFLSYIVKSIVGWVNIITKPLQFVAKQAGEITEQFKTLEAIFASRFGDSAGKFFDTMRDAANELGVEIRQLADDIITLTNSPLVQNRLKDPLGNIDMDAMKDLVKMYGVIQMTQPDIAQRFGSAFPNMLAGDTRSFKMGFEIDPESSEADARNKLAARKKKAQEELNALVAESTVSSTPDLINKIYAARQKLDTLKNTPIFTAKNFKGGIDALDFIIQHTRNIVDDDAFERLATQATASINRMKNAWTEMMKSLGGGKAYEVVKDFLKDIADWMQKIASTDMSGVIGDKLADQIKQLADWLRQLGKDVVDAFDPNLGIAENLKNIGTVLKGYIADAFNFALNEFRVAINTFGGDKALAGFDSLGKTMSSILDIIKMSLPMIGTVLTAIHYLVSLLASGIAATVLKTIAKDEDLTTINQARNRGKELAEAVKPFGSAAADETLRVINEIVNTGSSSALHKQGIASEDQLNYMLHSTGRDSEGNFVGVPTLADMSKSYGQTGMGQDIAEALDEFRDILLEMSRISTMVRTADRVIKREKEVRGEPDVDQWDTFGRHVAGVGFDAMYPETPEEAAAKNTKSIVGPLVGAVAKFVDELLLKAAMGYKVILDEAAIAGDQTGRAIVGQDPNGESANAWASRRRRESREKYQNEMMKQGHISPYIARPAPPTSAVDWQGTLDSGIEAYRRVKDGPPMKTIEQLEKDLETVKQAVINDFNRGIVSPLLNSESSIGRDIISKADQAIIDEQRTMTSRPDGTTDMSVTFDITLYDKDGKVLGHTVKSKAQAIKNVDPNAPSGSTIHVAPMNVFYNSSNPTE